MITRETINKALAFVAKKHGISSSSENLQEETQSGLPSWRQRTKTGADFIHNFHPQKARVLFSEYNIVKSLCGEVPTLQQAVEVYKMPNVVTWMTTLLANLCTYMGYGNMPNSTQVEGILDQFLQKYSHLRITEVMYYFECIKDGRYYEATIKLEPQSLIKGVVAYLGELNAKKDRWGNSVEEFSPEYLNGLCIEMLSDTGIDLKSYPKRGLAVLVGNYFTGVTWERFAAIRNKIFSCDDSWVYDLAHYMRNPGTMPVVERTNPLPKTRNLEKEYKYF